ncbi:MAG: hypothetical protein U0800_12560 [Isosphaeraceae bacterium]
MPRKFRKQTQPESPATEPTPVAEVLAASPIAQILASREAKTKIEPDQPMPENDVSEAVAAFLRQREREQAVEEPVSHVARLRKMQPAPQGFLPVATYAAAGIRVNKSFDRGTVGIQFEEARKASRDGLVNEVETLGIEGFRFEPLRRQWERTDVAQPGANIIGAGRLAKILAEKRSGRER